jgi:large subunit ribosomal protein L15
MKLDQLAPAKGATRKSVRVGRGIGSGFGKTSGRGQKGQGARSGGTKGVAFEGGQMPIAQRMPKRGFNNKRFRTAYEVLNVGDLERLAANGEVNPASLSEAGRIKKSAKLKILGEGQLNKSLTVLAHRFSKSAEEKIVKAGGKIEVIS